MYLALELALILTMGLGLVKVVDYHASALSRDNSEASQALEPIRQVDTVSTRNAVGATEVEPWSGAERSARCLVRREDCE